jgi:hypothetical protein
VNEVFALLGCLLFVTDVSGQPIGPVFKSQAFKRKGQEVTEFFDSLTLEYGTDRLSRNITN